MRSLIERSPTLIPESVTIRPRRPKAVPRRAFLPPSFTGIIQSA